MAKLVRVSRSQRLELGLDKKTTVIGRELTCDYAFENDPQISREHCGFRRYKDGAITVTDYGSSNGTFVNGERIFEETALQHRDKVRLGNQTEFVFEAPELVKEKPPEKEPAKPKTKPEKPPEPKSKLEKAAAELESELEDRSYAAVMRDLVGQTKRGKNRRKDTENKPNQYW